MSGIGAPPAGGVITVRGMVCVGSHSSTLVIVHTTMRAPFGSFSGLRFMMAEESRRSFGSMPTLGFGTFIRDVLTSLILAGSFAATPDIVQGMKLVRSRSACGEKPGLILRGEIFDLSGSFEALNPRAPTLDDIAAIAAVPAKALVKVEKVFSPAPPLRGIGKIIGVGLNYRDHAEETGLPLPKEPTLFLKATSAVCGPADDLVTPREANIV